MKPSKRAQKRLEKRVAGYEETMRTWRGHQGAFTKPGSQKPYKSN